MNDIQRIVDIVGDDRVMTGSSAWHGDAIWEILGRVSAAKAASHPIPGAHSIWEIVGHMAFWEDVATRRLAGLRAGLDEERNFPPAPAEATEANWQKTLEQFRASKPIIPGCLCKSSMPYPAGRAVGRRHTADHFPATRRHTDSSNTASTMPVKLHCWRNESDKSVEIMEQESRHHEFTRL